VQFYNVTTLVTKHVNRQNGKQKLAVFFSGISLLLLWLFIVSFNDAKPLPTALNCSGNCTVTVKNDIDKFGEVVLLGKA